MIYERQKYWNPAFNDSVLETQTDCSDKNTVIEFIFSEQNKIKTILFLSSEFFFFFLKKKVCLHSVLLEY